jgi:hypothetical protein
VEDRRPGRWEAIEFGMRKEMREKNRRLETYNFKI